MTKARNRLNREPALIAGVATSVVAALVAFGVLDPLRGDALTDVVLALLPLVSAIVIRRSVWSPRSVQEVVEHAAAPAPTGNTTVWQGSWHNPYGGFMTGGGERPGG